MASHSRPLANLLCKNAPKKGVKKIDMKMDIKKENNKKSK